MQGIVGVTFSIQRYLYVSDCNVVSSYHYKAYGYHDYVIDQEGGNKVQGGRITLS